MARINLKKFIAEHYKGGVSARDVIREAVTNAIHAGGKNISIDLIFSDRTGDLFQDSEERRSLEQIIVSDDGEGFTPENLHYFDEICTSHKDSIGGKGVGRLAFLKYASTVEIKSQIPGKLIEFDYTPDFKPDEVRTTVRHAPQNTQITLRNLKERINTQVTKLVNSICDDLRLILFLKHQQNQSITLKFTHNSRQPFSEYYEFSGRNIKALAEREFDISHEKFKCYLFRDEPPKKGIISMLCADELCIEEYVISKKFDTCRHLIFITSNYFNSRSNLERQRLELPKTDDETDLASGISREKLMPRIHEECMSMINETAKTDIDAFKESNIKKLKEYYPFIKLGSLGGNASLLDAEEIIKTYRAQQAKKEDQVVEALEAGKNISLDDISHLASEDLARFIVHRALVIDSLDKLPPESAEDAVHNAILPKKSDGTEIRENNVWIVDDKFLSYSNVYSDKTLAAIISEVNKETESKQQRRPDIAAFYSRDNENRPNKLVIIEFKKPGADIFENNKSLLQCRLYANDLTNKIPTVREVFAFSVVTIDDEFYLDLKQTGFKDIFSLSERVIYNDYSVGANSDIPLHLYVMPATALIKDAKARNRVFEEILQFDTQDQNQ